MRIIRYRDRSGRTGYGAEETGGRVVRLEGDPFGRRAPTAEPVDVEKVLAPVEPPAVYCIGLNYRRHAEETKAAIPAYPIVFMKGPNAIQHPGDPVLLPVFLASDKVDYEGELAVVIGRPCRNVRRERALDYVLGYACANDISARDWQKEKGGGQWCRAKTFDTFAPVGPRLVTADEIPDPNALRIRTVLNGRTVQDGSTSDMIFDVPALIAFLSGSTTLLPGTVILTGTPEGVGMARQPPLWLKPGDTVSVEIERIGTLTNPVASEPV